MNAGGRTGKRLKLQADAASPCVCAPAQVSQRWRFMKTPQGVVKMGNAEVLPNARLPDLGQALDSRGYQVRGGSGGGE